MRRTPQIVSFGTMPGFLTKCARLLIAEVGLLTAGNLVQVVADGGGIGFDIDRQNVLQQAGCHAEGHQ